MATKDKYGLSIGVPPGWQKGAPSVASQLGMGDAQPDPYADPNVQGIKDSMAKMGKDESARQEVQLEGQGILMRITDGSRTLPGEEPNQIDVKHVILPGDMDLENGAKVARQELDFAHNPEFIDTPMGKAARFILNFSNKSGDHIHKVTYVFVDGKEMYELQFSCTGEDNKIKAIADPMAQTFRVKPGLAFTETDAKS